ncbi:MAG: M48 family metalloprotease [Thermoleophilaceae bacterium]
MSRRLDRTTPALVLTLLAFVAFGMVRVAAPVSALGVVFKEPLGFAVVAAITALAGAALLFVRPIELAVSRRLAGPSRLPSDSELERLGGMLERIGGRAGIDPGRLILRVLDDGGINASAGAGHLLFVTTAALRLPDEQLEAILAHELGHHRGLHPIAALVVWWLSLPGIALAAVYRFLRRTVGTIGARFGSLGRLLAVPVLVLLVIWQVTVMWLFYVADLLSKRADRLSEFSADGAAARWGYGGQLAEALESAAGQEDEVTSRIARLMADHPPVGERILRLREA